MRFLVYGWRYMREPFPLCYVNTEDEARAECARLAATMAEARKTLTGRLLGGDPVTYSYRQVWL